MDDRQRLPPLVATPREVTACIFPGVFLLVGPAIAASLCNTAINGYWKELYARVGRPWPIAGRR